MKVIDLLNKIAKGEETPQTIKYNGIEYERCYGGADYYNKHYEEYLLSDVLGLDRLNDEIITKDETQEQILAKIDELIDNIRRLKGGDE